MREPPFSSTLIYTSATTYNSKNLGMKSNNNSIADFIIRINAE